VPVVREEFGFGILGSTIVQLHDRSAVHRIGHRRLRQVLAVLLTQPGRRVSFEQLTTWVWSEREPPPRDPESTFHTYGHRIRKSLEAYGVDARLITDSGGLKVDVEERVIDYFRFRELIMTARFHRDRGEHEEALDLATAAVGLWRDRPLADLDTEPARNWRRRVVGDEWIPANELLLDEQITLGRYEFALLRLDELDRWHRFEVNLVKRRLTVLHAVSRYSEATAFYLSTHRSLRQDARDEEARDLRDHYEGLKRLGQPKAVPRRTELPGGGGAVPPPRQLPPEVVDFAGRVGLLDELDELTGVRSGGLRPATVALSGLGGIGKTATAVRWASRAAGRSATGTLFANLRGVSRTRRMEAGEVVDEFLAALGYPVEHIVGPAGRAEKLRALLEAQPMIVVLDNAENTAHVRTLLPLFTGCTVVITSRRHLTELGVQHGVPSLTVGPLEVDEAVALLASRTRRRAKEDLEVLPALAGLCGGLPLALTLVAERAVRRPEIPLRALADQLRDRETLLNIGNDGDGPDSSLDAIFSVSYEALSVETGRLFRLLGLHPGTEFGVEVAAALAGESPSWTRRWLDELVGAHLLEQPGDVDRYRMHDLLFAYAARRAGHGPESGRARERMLSFYLHTACQADLKVFPHLGRPPMPPVVPGGEPRAFSDELSAMRWFRTERAVLAGMTVYGMQTGLHAYAWRVPHLIAHAFDRMGFYADIAAAYTAVVNSAAWLDEPVLATTLSDLGYYLTGLGETAGASEHLHRAARIVSRLDDPLADLTVKINLAGLARREGRRPAAVEMYRECLRIARGLGDREREAKVEHRLGEIFAEKRLHDLAIGHFERALRLWEAIPDEARQVATLAELCAIERVRARYAVAEELGARAQAVLEGVRDVSSGIRLHAVLAELALDRDRLPEAVGFARRVLELAEPTGSVEAAADALDLLGQAWLRLGDREAARTAWRRAADIFRDRGQAWRSGVLDRRLADLGPEPVIPDSRSVTDVPEVERDHHP
jgi:tetratricopeptide (TPR) repeat protein/DNA-binding SARP family transcriptional activator